MKKLFLLLLFIPSVAFSEAIEDTLDVTFKVYTYKTMSYMITITSGDHSFFINDNYKLPIFSYLVSIDIPDLEQELHTYTGALNAFINAYKGYYKLEAGIPDYLIQDLIYDTDYEFVYEITLRLNCWIFK
jgi:hypothetical protein